MKTRLLSSNNEIWEWPALVGKTVEDAKTQILKDFPEADIKILPEGSPISKDLWLNRVRIFFNENNLVSEIPRRE
jgi:hypothetical protein